ncbi:MAG: hypothetical protein ACHQXA_04660 [Gemmatimonadales bacterium]
MTFDLRLLAAGTLLLAAACRFEQRPPAGGPREQAAVQTAVAGYYDGLARGEHPAARDTAFDRDSLVLVRADIQLQRDLAGVWATIRLHHRGAGGGEDPARLQQLLLRRGAAGWTVMHVATAAP